MSNLVTTGLIGGMASILARKLGRKVYVHRVEYKLRLPSGRFKNQIRYTLVIEGSHPPMFPGLTVNEVKGRMAMLTDLIISGVISSGNSDVSDSDRSLGRAECRALASSLSDAERLRLEEPGAQGDHPSIDQSPGSDDSY